MTQVFEDVAATSEHVYTLSGKGEDPEKLEGAKATITSSRFLAWSPLSGAFLPPTKIVPALPTLR